MLLQDDGTRLPPMEDEHLEPTIQVPMDWPTPVNGGQLAIARGPLVVDA